MANQIATNSKVIGGTDEGFGHPAICRLSTTVMLAAHINESDELELHKSINDGVAWTLKKTLSNASGCFNLISMTSTKAGLVYQKNSNEFEVWVSTDSGDTWTNKLDITSMMSDAEARLIYNGSLGRLYLTHRATTATSDYMVKYSDNDGASWTDGVTLVSWIYNPVDIDINPINNYIYIPVWFSTVYRNYIWIFDSVGTQTSIPDYGAVGNEYHDKNLAIDSTGNWYFAYVRRYTSTSKEYLTVRKNGGSETDLYAPDTDNIIIKGSSSIGIDEDDNVFVYYTKTSDEKTYYRKYDAGTSTWEAEVELIAVANNRINTEKHVLALSNKLHFVYYQAP